MIYMSLTKFCAASMKLLRYSLADNATCGGASVTLIPTTDDRPLQCCSWLTLHASPALPSCIATHSSAAGLSIQSADQRALSILPNIGLSGRLAIIFCTHGGHSHPLQNFLCQLAVYTLQLHPLNLSASIFLQIALLQVNQILLYLLHHVLCHPVVEQGPLQYHD